MTTGAVRPHREGRSAPPPTRRTSVTAPTVTCAGEPTALRLARSATTSSVPSVEDMTYGHRRQAESLRETAYERGYAAGWHDSNGPLESVEFERGYTRGRHDRERTTPVRGVRR